MNGARDLPFRLALIVPLLVLTGYFLLLVGSQYAFFSAATLLQQLALPEIQSAIALSLGSATVSALLAVAIAIPAAYLLARREFPGKRLVVTFLDLPVVLTPIALGTLILMAWNTPAGRLLDTLGMTLPFTVAGVVVTQFTVVAAIALRLLKTTFEQIDPRYEQVAVLWAALLPTASGASPCRWPGEASWPPSFSPGRAPLANSAPRSWWQAPPAAKPRPCQAASTWPCPSPTCRAQSP